MNWRMKAFYAALEQSKSALRSHKRYELELAPWDGQTQYTICCNESLRQELTRIIKGEATEFLPYKPGTIPAEFAGKILLVYNRSNADELKHLMATMDTDVALASIGKPSLRCLRPAPDAFALSRAALEKLGGLDEVFDLPHIRLADLAVRAIKSGLESVAVEGDMFECPVDGVDGDLFISKHGYALPEDDYLSESLLDEYLDQAGDALVIAERLPHSAGRLYSEKGCISLICNDAASLKAGSTLLGTKWLADNLNGFNVEEGTCYDTILICQSVSKISDFVKMVPKLRNSLKPEGRLLFFEENVIGFHRLGKFLSQEVRNGIAKPFSVGTLEKLGIPCASKPLNCDMQAQDGIYETLLKTLMQAYPSYALPMRNTLGLRATLYAVQGEPYPERKEVRI